MAIALVNPSGTVTEFISYGGDPLTASDGPASGMTSVTMLDVGHLNIVHFNVRTLQLGGSGTCGPDFVWSGPAWLTPGLRNTGSGAPDVQLFNEPAPPRSCVCLWQHVRRHRSFSCSFTCT